MVQIVLAGTRNFMNPLEILLVGLAGAILSFLSQSSLILLGLASCYVISLLLIICCNTYRFAKIVKNFPKLAKEQITDIGQDDKQMAALVRASSTFRGTKDKIISKFLATIALDQTYSRNVRLFAYSALFQVCDRLPSRLPPFDEFKMPEDLDMSFLQEYVEEKKVSGPFSE